MYSTEVFKVFFTVYFASTFENKNNLLASQESFQAESLQNGVSVYL